MVAGGMTAQQIVDELPPLEIEDVAAALRSRPMRLRIVRSRCSRRREVPHRPEPFAAAGQPARDRGHDAAHTLELGLERAEDDALLMLAAQEDRVIVSGDTDFGALLALLRRRSPSVILFRIAAHAHGRGSGDDHSRPSRRPRSRPRVRRGCRRRRRSNPRASPATPARRLRRCRPNLARLTWVAFG